MLTLCFEIIKWDRKRIVETGAGSNTILKHTSSISTSSKKFTEKLDNNFVTFGYIFDPLFFGSFILWLVYSHSLFKVKRWYFQLIQIIEFWKSNNWILKSLKFKIINFKNKYNFCPDIYFSFWKFQLDSRGGNFFLKWRLFKKNICLQFQSILANTIAINSKSRPHGKKG